MNKAIKVVESISNLANKKSYEYSEEQVGAMFSVLENTIADVKSTFLPKKERWVVRVSSKKNKGVFVAKRNKQAEQDRVQAYFIKMYPEVSEKLKLQKKPWKILLKR